jgi:hypothetical protein
MKTSSSKTMQAHAAANGQQSLALLNIAIEAVKSGLTQGIHNVFIFSLVLMVVGLIAVLFIKEIPLKDRTRSTAGAPDEAVEDASHESSLAAMI